jgi:hypothetical protein
MGGWPSDDHNAGTGACWLDHLLHSLTEFVNPGSDTPGRMVFFGQSNQSVDPGEDSAIVVAAAESTTSVRAISLDSYSQVTDRPLHCSLEAFNISSEGISRNLFISRVWFLETLEGMFQRFGSGAGLFPFHGNDLISEGIFCSLIRNMFFLLLACCAPQTYFLVFCQWPWKDLDLKVKKHDCFPFLARE